jgi:hypothetical protein
MKKQTQLAGGRRWFGSDLTDMNNAVIEALEGLFDRLNGSNMGEGKQFILKGCDLTYNAPNTTISAGVVFCVCADGAYRICSFPGATYAVSSEFCFVKGIQSTVTRLYADGVTKEVSEEWIAQRQVSNTGGLLNLAAARKTLLDAMQGQYHRLIADTERTAWNAKYDSSNFNNNTVDFAARYITCSDLTVTSDKRVKRSIKKLTGTLKDVNKLRAVRYKRKNDDELCIGLIAQEVEQVYPEVVRETAGIKGVAYANLTAPIIGAIQELTAMVLELQDKVKRLESK